MTATALPQNNKREIWGWAMYDWANSAFSTTIGSVFLGPYVADLARQAAAGAATASFFGLPVAPDSFLPYCISFSVGLQVLFLPILGAIADYSHLRKQMMRVFAFIGAFLTMALFLVTPATWWLGGILFILANLAFGASIVFYNSYLPDIASEDQRDSVSSFGWAMGYMGGGLLLLLNLVLFQFRKQIFPEDTTSLALRINLASAGVWWLGWSLWTFATLQPRHAVKALPAGENYLTIGFKQLAQTFREAKHYPHTLRFLLAYLLYNDGIQTIIGVTAIFAAAPLLQGGLAVEQGTLILVILMIQFVGFFGALGFGWLARRVGAVRALILSLVLWTVVVIYAYFGLRGETLIAGMPQRVFEFWFLGAAVALVLGGSQALSRSLFAQMIPPGKEAEFFAIYEVSERGTSWTGPLVFGLANQLFGSLRPAILSLIIYFVVGLTLLFFFVDVPRAIRESKNLVKP